MNLKEIIIYAVLIFLGMLATATCFGLSIRIFNWLVSPILP